MGKMLLSMAIAVVYSMSCWWRTIPSITLSNPDSSTLMSSPKVFNNVASENTQHRNLNESPSRPPLPPSRILLGIFTTNRKEDFVRRKLIRKTYLSTYKTLREVGLAHPDESSDRICSLADLMEKKGNTAKECLIVYTFVMGAWDRSNTTAVTDLTEFDDDAIPYVVDRSTTSQDYEHDVLYLNIRENMNFGKSETWFRYASTILPSADLGIDLIFKADSDTVVSPRPLLSDLESILSRERIKRPANEVYGGVHEVGRSNEVLYMQGGFYFLSRDVASHITSKECLRKKIVQQSRFDRGFDRSEDADMGNFVAICWQNESATGVADKNLRRILLDGRTSATHGFILKDSDRFRVTWKDRLGHDLALLRYNEIKDKYRGGCPTETEELDEELKWFDLHPNMKLAKLQFAKLCR